MRKIIILPFLILLTNVCFGAHEVVITNPNSPVESLCQGNSFQITTSVSGANSLTVSYVWKINNQLQSSFNSSFTYTAINVGNDTCVVIASTIIDTSYDTVIMVVRPKPVAGFVITGNNSCSGSPVLFTNISNLFGVGYPADSTIWLFPGANDTVANTYNITGSRTYQNAGLISAQYPVTLIVTTNDGCKDTVLNYVTVKPLPLRPITPSPIGYCINDIPMPISATGTSLLWYTSATGGIGDTNSPTPSTAIDTTLIYFVTQTDSSGCESERKQIEVIIDPVPVASFTVPIDSICSGSTVSYINTSINASQFIWKYGDGKISSSSSHIFDTIGNFSTIYTTWLIAISQYGCKDSVSHLVTIKQKPDVRLKSDYPAFSDFENYPDDLHPFLFKKCNITPPHELQLANLSQTAATNTNYFIKWGDGAFNNSLGNVFGSPFNTYANMGSYVLTDSVSGENGCSAVKNYNVFIGTTPNNITITNIENVTDECAPQTYPFQITYGINDTPGTLYIISTNDGSPDDTLINPLSSNPDTIYRTFNTTSCGFNSPNNINSFFVRINAKNFCSLIGKISTIEPITLNSRPHSSLTGPLNGCAGMPMNFNSNSLHGSYINPNTLYCDESTIKYFWEILPDTGWTLQSGALGTILNYNGTQQINVIFDSAGTYSVQLKTANANINICRDDSVFQHQVCISPQPDSTLPLFLLNKNTFCLPDTVKILNLTDTLSFCENLDYIWNISCTNNSCNSPGCSGISYVNGSSQFSRNPDILFTQPGIYLISLTIDNACGNTTSIIQTITVKDKPTATFIIPTSVCIGENLCINQSGNVNITNCYGLSQSYLWISSLGAFINPTSQLPGCANASSPGIHSVELSVTNECGIFTVINNLIVISLPMVNAGFPQTICNGANVLLNGTVGGSATGGVWVSNAGGVFLPDSNTLNATWVPPVNFIGNAILTLTTIGMSPCVADTSTIIITVRPLATVNAGLPQTICQGGTTSGLSGSVGGSASGGIWSTPAGGTFMPDVFNLNATWTPPAGYSGTALLTLTTTGMNPCPSVVSIVNIVVKPTPTADADTSQTICSNGTAFLNGSIGGAATGGVWTSNTGGTFSPNSTTLNASWTPPFNYTGNAVLTLTTTGMAPCFQVSSSVIVSVIPDPIITLQPMVSQSLCQNATASTLIINVSGGTGTITYQWYSNVNNNNTGGTIIPGATGASYLPLTAIAGVTYYYCVVSQTGSGCSVTSTTATVIVYLSPVFSLQPLPSSVCTGGIPTQLTVAYMNGTGAVSYQWYSNTINSNIGGIPIPGATIASYDPPATSPGIVYYYCIITFSTGGCSIITSNVAMVEVFPDPSISSQPITSQSMCEGGIATPLTLNYIGGIGFPTYQWYSNTNNSTTGGTLISGANLPTYTPPTFNTTGTYYFYATVILSGNGCDATTTNAANIIVVADPEIDNQAIASQTVCQNTSPVNLVITVSGGIGTIFYQWFSNTVNSNSGGAIILGAIGPSYTPITTTTGTFYYYCDVLQTGSGCYAVSATSSVIVNAAPVFTLQPLSSTLCVGGIPSTLIVNTMNGTGIASYQWYTNAINSNTGGIPILGATNASYDPPATTPGIVYYYCIIIFSSGGCPAITSNVAMIYLKVDPTISSQPVISQDICEGGNATQLTLSYTGGTGIPTYQWFSNTINSSVGGTAIGGTNSQSYTPPTFNVAGFYYFYATVTLTGNGCDATTTNTGLVTVIVDPVIDTQAISTQSLCQNALPTNLIIYVSGGIGTYSYQWYANTINTTTGGSMISGATGSTYIPLTTIVGTTYYYCIVTQTVAGCSVTSATAEVVVNAAPVFTLQPFSSTICLGGIPTQLSVSYVNGTGAASYQWYANTINSNTGGTAISGAITSVYNPPSSIAGIVYYYCIITFSSGGCASITSIVAMIDIKDDPSINSQPVISQDICEGGNATQLILSYTGGNGIPTYQWYSNTINSSVGGTAISGTNSQSYTPPTFNVAGFYYFYATVTLTGNGCDATTSNTGRVTVVVDPVIDTQAIATQSLCQNAVPTNLIIYVSGGIGTYSYQWYANTMNTTTGGIMISGTTGSTYIPLTTIVGTTYYYCIVTQTGAGCSVTSAIAEVIVNAAPVFTLQPFSSTICVGGVPTQLSVSYVNGTGAASYQWYANTINSNTGGTAISGAITSVYNPPSSIAGIVYYYCIITFSSGGCASITSNVAMIDIKVDPTISSQPLISQDICEGGNATQLTLSYTGGTGIPTYQWYSNTINSSVGGTAISGTNSQNYTPPTFNVAGFYYFYATVNLTGNGCDATSTNTGLITVVVDPVIDTQAIATQSLCQNAVPANLIIYVSGGIGTYSFQWYANTMNTTTGGSMISGAIGATYIPLTTIVGTTYYYCIVTQTGAGCSVTSATSTVIVNPASVFSLQPFSSDTCEGFLFAPISVNYINGTGTAIYQWYSNTVNNTLTGIPISGANTNTFTPPYTLTGTMYYYCIISFNSGGCASITSDIAAKTIHLKPVANYIYTPAIGGHPLNVSFTNQSTPLLLSSHWIFGNNFPDLISQNSIVSLTNTGIIDSIYNVILIVTTVSGCKDTVSHAVTVYPLPIVKFGATNVCFGLSTQFTDSSQNTTGIINRWKWYFGDGDSLISNTSQPPFTHTYANAGSYIVTLTVTNDLNISNSISRNVIVHPLPIPDFTTTFDTLGCVSPASVGFTNTSTGAHLYLWHFGDGFSATTFNALHSYTTTGYYFVKLIDTTQFKCVDSIEHSIRIITPPTSDFALSVPDSCGPLLVNFTNQSTGLYLNYLWDFGIPPVSTLSGPFTRMYPPGINDTIYFVSLTATNICGTDIHNDSITVLPVPITNFGMNQNWGCSPLPLIFLDTIIGHPDNLSWDFGDGSPVIYSTSFSQVVNHTFYYTGSDDTTYYITLIANNICGSDTTVKALLVYPNTTNAFFNTDTLFGCNPLTVHFTDFSQGATNYTWHFGDGNTSQQVSPIHTYTTAGNYIAYLAISNNCSNDTIWSDTIKVFPSPVVAFSFNGNHCTYDSVSFTALTSGLSQYSWDFGDGIQTSVIHPKHLYSNSGTYPVQLIGYNEFGCSDTVTQNIIIQFTPNAKFSITDNSGCSPHTTGIINQTNNLNLNNYSWTMANGNAYVLIQPPPQTFSNTSNCNDTFMQIKLVAENFGCYDSISDSVRVLPLPLSSFSIQDSCGFGLNSFVQVNNQSICATAYNWNINGNPVSVQSNPMFTIPAPGYYTLQNIASNIFNCKDTSEIVYHLYQSPFNSITMDTNNICEPYPATPINFSALVDSLNYQWNFGDGTSATGQHVSHVYNLAGSYTVNVNIRGIGGCVDSAQLNTIVQVHPRAIAMFETNYDPAPYPDFWRVIFLDQSLNASTWNWDFGDSQTNSGIQHPVHEYDNPGFYWVTLTVSNIYGCPDSTGRSIRIKGEELIYAPNAFTPNGDGVNDQFLPVGNFNKDANFEMLIFNRWGELVYKTTTYDPWQGFVRGTKEICLEGIYIWVVSYKDMNGLSQIARGRVSLLR